MFIKCNKTYFLNIEPNIESVKLLDMLLKLIMHAHCPQFPDTPSY